MTGRHFRRHFAPAAASVAVGALLAVALAGCGRAQTAAEVVRADLDRTRALSRRFTYSDVTDGRDLKVEGTVEDDLRFAATVSIAGHPALDEVVRDDAVAARLRDPASLPQFQGATAPSADQVATLSKLEAGQWVIDSTGAPSLAAPPTSKTSGPPPDPLLEAMQAFDYVKTAVGQAATVVRFSPEDVSYIASEDPFPRPAAGEIRYDLRPPPLPRPGATGAINQVVPDVQNFRKMSIYVRAGLVVSVRETIDVRSQLQAFVRIYGAKLPPHASLDDQAAFAIDVTNKIRKAEGQAPIVIRTMSLTLTDLGSPVSAALPSGASDGDLGLLNGLGVRVRKTLG